ncbi:MAG: gamma-glutamyltransferase [Rhodobacteraceae bacterium]|nr:gamma-glutamyltransferase [Paracoccaceae bacterium]
MSRDFALPGRSTVHASEAMAATSHPYATAAALDILRRGGTAVDAAISASAVLAVVEPAETGIGGDCFALIAPEGRLPPIAFNGSGPAPKAATPEWFLDRGFTSIPDESPHSVTVPGAIDAWWRLHERFGRLEFRELLRPAIRYAEEGYIVHGRVAEEWVAAQDRLLHDPGARALFLTDGCPPREGRRVRNVPLAQSLSLIADQGRDAFYEGQLAETIVRHLRDLGGLHTMEDFAATAGEFVDPVACDFHGRTVYQLPPNSQGPVALLLLRLLERFDTHADAFDAPEFIHLVTEAARVAYDQRDAYLGDAERSGAFMRLLDDDAIEALVQKIDPERAAGHRAINSAASNTVYLSVVDRERTAVSFINSIFHSFGSGICAPGTGILLQNRGHSFSLTPGHSNCIGSQRRPMHTIIPGMVGRGDRAELSFGVMGGDYQPIGHAHVLSAMLSFGHAPQAACDAPRFMPVGERLEVETGVGAKTREALQRMGHTVVPARYPLGGAQIIAIDWEEGTLSGGSDARKDGCALGY